jgi:hypothetical protein
MRGAGIVREKLFCDSGMNMIATSRDRHCQVSDIIRKLYLRDGGSGCAVDREGFCGFEQCSRMNLTPSEAGIEAEESSSWRT